MAAAYYLAGQGIHITGIIDRTGGPLKADGFGLEEIRGLLLARKGNTLAGNDLLSFEEINTTIWSIFLFQRRHRTSWRASNWSNCLPAA